MSDSANDPEFDISPQQFRRSWRIVTIAGLLATAYGTTCILGAPRVKFLTELHATPFDFGFIAMAGSLAIAFQILSGILVNHLKRRKPLWMVVTITHRLLFAGLLVAPALFTGDRVRIWWIVCVLILHDSLAQMSAPLWLSWMTDLMPRDSFNRLWASRQRVITAFNIFFCIFLALAFNYFEQHQQVVLGFTIVASLAIVAGVTDILLFWNVPEPPNVREPQSNLLRTMILPLRDRNFRPFLKFMSYWNFSALLAAPFFSLYLIKVIHLDVMSVQLILAAEAVGIVVSSRLWGLLCDTYGSRSTLQIAVACKSLIVLAYLVAPPIPQIAIPLVGIATFFDGIMNAGMVLAMQAVMLQSSPRLNRTMYIATTNFLCVGVAGGAAPLIAGSVIDQLNASLFWVIGPYQVNGYHFIFALSLILRLGSYSLAGKIHEPQSVPVRTILSHLCITNPIRVISAIYALHEAPEDAKRTCAAELLGNIRSPLAIRELIQALKDTSHHVRAAAADALGKIGVAEAAEPLARALCDPARGIESPAARALGLIGGAQSLRVLLANLHRMNADALGETVDSLARIGDDAAILPLICLFDEVQSPSLRQKIARALTRLGAGDSIDDTLAVISVGANGPQV